MLKPQLSFPLNSCVLDVHIQAEGAAVELGCANFNEQQSAKLHAAFLYREGEFGEFSGEFWILLQVVQSLCHDRGLLCVMPV